MADKLNVRLTATDDASKVIDQVADKAEALEGRETELTVTMSRADVLDEINRIQTVLDELEGKDTAVDVVARVEAYEDLEKLGATLRELDTQDVEVLVQARDEATSRIDTIDRAIRDVRSAGGDVTVLLNARDNVSGVLDEIDGELRRLDGQEVNIRADTSGLDRVTSSGGQARSVLANMVGNSAQDLGAVAGVAGSAGVALGQMAEYAADGNISLAGFAKVVGPVAAVGLAAAIVSSHFKTIAANKAFDSAQVEGFVDALREGGDQAAKLAERLREAGTIEFRVLGETQDATDSLNALGLTVDQFTQLVTGGKPAIDEYAATLAAAGVSSDDSTAALIAAYQQAENYAEAQEAAAAAAKLFVVSQNEVTAAVDEFLAKQSPVDQFPGSFARIAAALHSGVAPAAADVQRVMDGLGLSMDEVLAVASELAAENARLAANNGQLAVSFDDVAVTTSAAAQAASDAATAASAEADALEAVVGAAEASATAHQSEADAILASLSARRSAADATYALRDAQREFAEDLWNAQAALNAEGVTAGEAQAAMDGLAQSAAGVADSAVLVSMETAAANEQVLTAAQGGDVWRSSMLETAATAGGPLREAILGMVAQVERIPPEKVTEISAALDAGNIDLANQLWCATRDPDSGSLVPLCHSLLRDVRMVCFPRGAVADPGVKPLPIVPDLYPMRNRRHRLSTSWEHGAIHELVL